MLNAGWTTNVFQLESQGMGNAIGDIGLSDFEDIVALVALYRPGPMDQIPIYGERKRGRAPITYPHPALAGVLAKSYGIPIYQEQIMELARKLAGYSLGEADLLRRAMGKKIAAEMAALETSFVAGCVKNEALEPRMNKLQAKEISPWWRSSPATASTARTRPPTPASPGSPPGSSATIFRRSPPPVSTRTARPPNASPSRSPRSSA